MAFTDVFESGRKAYLSSIKDSDIKYGSYFKELEKYLNDNYLFKNIPITFDIKVNGNNIPINLRNNVDILGNSTFNGPLIGVGIESYLIDNLIKDSSIIIDKIQKDNDFIYLKNNFKNFEPNYKKYDYYTKIELGKDFIYVPIEIKTCHVDLKRKTSHIYATEKQKINLDNYGIVVVLFYEESTKIVNNSFGISVLKYKVYTGDYIKKKLK